MNYEAPNKRYKASKGLVYCCQYHVVLCTKYRRQLFDNRAQKVIQSEIELRQKDLTYTLHDVQVGGSYVHLVITVSHDLGIDSTLTLLKKYLSRKILMEFPTLKTKVSNLWTRERFISSVGVVSTEHVSRFIEQGV